MGFQLFEVRRNSYALVVASLVVVSFAERSELFEALPIANDLIFEVNTIYKFPFDSSDIQAEFYSRAEWGTLLTRDNPLVYSLLHAGPIEKPKVAPVELFYSMPGGHPELFFRYSANHSDPRVMKNGRIKAGTYATTYNDSRMIPSGLAAVGRYALPVSAAAEFMFPIMTNGPYRMGTALPHFGQAGGGVEVFFKDEFQMLVAEPHQIPIG
ncbi:MAG: hypothetical protein QM780_15770 [Hyphomicrobium sp.]|uniref:hypothetical protein n=1 Tax=Hyphomicrobium sp. TaxID=82 RepID=UPI0039E31369